MRQCWALVHFPRRTTRRVAATSYDEESILLRDPTPRIQSEDRVLHDGSAALSTSLSVQT